MRKIDYQILASIIKSGIADALEKSKSKDEVLRIVAPAVSCALADLAKEFAKNANVNRAEFLKLCGL